jgi:hypothetical protein
VNGGPQIRKPLHDPVALRQQVRFVRRDVRDGSEAIHLQFENEVLVIEGIADERGIGRNELRERQCAFSIVTTRYEQVCTRCVPLSAAADFSRRRWWEGDLSTAD